MIFINIFSFLFSANVFARVTKGDFVFLKSVLFFLLQVLLTTQVLLFLGIFNEISVFIASILFFFLSLFILFQFDKTKFLNHRKFELSELLVLLFFMVIFIFSSFIPIYEIDSLAYHLPIVQNFIQTGGMWDIYYAPFVGPNTYFPANHEALLAFFVLISNTYNFLSLPNFLAALSLFLGLDFFADFKNKFTTFLTFLFSISIPFLFNQFVNVQIDLFMFSFFALTLIFLIKSLKEKSFQFLLYALLSFSLILGAKYNSIPQFLFLLPLIIFVFFKLNPSFKKFIFSAMVLTFPSMIWYLRNLFLTSNPIYPFSASLGPLKFFGYGKFVEDTSSTSILSSINEIGLNSTFSEIYANNLFFSELGEFSLLILVLVIFLFAYLFIIAGKISFFDKVKNFFRKKNFRKSALLIFLYLFLTQFFYYISSPYTFTLWNQTIRYSSSIFAIIPVFLIFSFQEIKSFFVKNFLTSILLFILVHNLLFYSFIFDSLYLEKFIINIDKSIILMIFIALFYFFVRFKITRFSFLNYSTIYLLAALSLTFFNFFMIDVNVPSDDKFLAQKTFDYMQKQPFLEYLRSESEGDKKEVALVGILDYWIWNRDNFDSFYVNIDGSDFKYHDYSKNGLTVRESYAEEKWLLALREKGVDYLFIDYKAFANFANFYEEEWAQKKSEIFEEIMRSEGKVLYKLNFL